MTTPFARPLPPLVDLPAPRRLPREATNLVPPGEIIAESTGALRRRLLRICWAPGLVLLGLWYLLLVLYVAGSSPTYWFLSLLAGLAERAYFRAALAELGFTASGLWTAFLLLPAAATVLSLLAMLLAPGLVAGLQPRRFLTERDFQHEVSTRVTAMLMAPPTVIVLAWPLTVMVGMPQPWTGLGAGQLSSWSLAVGALPLAWLAVRRLVGAPSLLGITAAAELEATGRIARDPEERRAAAEQARAQDRRHLPPNLDDPALRAAATPRGALAALAHITRASLRWVLPAAAGAGGMIFWVTDVVTVFVGLTAMDLTEVSSPLRWQHALVVAPTILIVLLGLALLPALAVPLAASQRDLVRDLRSHPEWAHRARVNPWEARVVTLTGWFAALWGLSWTIVAVIALDLLQVANGVTVAWAVVTALVLVPLLGGAAASGMRSGLRDVLYGPAGDFMRRESPYALIAPEVGTRSDRAKDPAVRAALRKRLQAGGGDHALEIFDLDVAGERLWVDDSAPGAKDTAVRAADLVQGTLPDFGSEGSAHTGGGIPAGDASDLQAAPPHRIPESVTGLREP